MRANGKLMPRAIRIAKGKNADLTPYPSNSPNKNLLNHSAMNLACLTNLSSLERALTHLPHPSWLATRRSGTSTKMLEQFLLNQEIVRRKLDVERTLISKHREQKSVHHIFQSDNKLTPREEECVKRGRPMPDQMSQPFNIMKAL